MDQIIAMASDILLGAGALGAAIYCIVLARRLKRFNNLENGVGGAVAVLSAQVDDMTRTLDQARKAAAESAETLTALTERAEGAARKLELMMASLHDLPNEEKASATDRQLKQKDVETEKDEDWEAVVAADTGAEPAQPLFSTKRAPQKEVAA